MKKLHINPGKNTPEINFSPDENIFIIRGTSSPEDVRALYYPVIEWFNSFINEIMEEGNSIFTSENPLKFQIDLKYFNSSSAKFLYDIFSELRRLRNGGIPFIIEWFFEEDDVDLQEAGSDIASIAELEFIFIEKKKRP